MSDSMIQIAGEGDGAFNCASGDSILSAALRAGLSFPYECNSGGCGACRFELVDGTVADQWPAAPGISERQRARGGRLACQSLPAGDCTIRIRLGAEEPPVRPARFMAKYAGSRALTADMAEFTFQGDAAARFLPGQFAMLDLPGLGSLRAYSMSNIANSAGIWQFIVKRVPGGQGTGVLFEALAAGDQVAIDGPYGNSYLRMDNDRPIVCIAGGSGLSPVMSIVRGIVQDRACEERRLLVFYGGRGPADLRAADVFESDAELRERVELFTAISDPAAPGADTWNGGRGMIHEVVRARLGETMSAHEFYFCGPPAMTDAVHRMLLVEAGVPAGQLHFDRFY
jgi:toluene monooxygenase electron transfer component